MAKQTINIGSAELAGDGESLRSAFDKINDNFNELYAADVSVDAQFLEGNPGAFYLDYTNLVNTPQIPLDVSDLTDSTNLLSGSGIAGENLDALADVSYDPVTLVGPPSVNGQPLVWDTVESKWYPGFATTVNTLTANTRVQLNGNGSEIEWVDDTSNGGVQPYFRTRVRFTGTITQDHTITFPAADGTIALTNQLNGVHIGQYTGNVDGDVTGSVFADDSTVLVDGVNGTLNSSALTKPIALADDEKITFGDSDDLQIYHSGGQNVFAGTATTILTGNWLYLRKSGTAENYLVCKGDGAVELYYDNVKKLETTTDGVAVTGKITGLTDPTAAQDAATKAYVDTNFLTAGGTLTGSSLEAEAVGAGVADGNDLAISGGDATEINSTGGDANITGGSGALASGNVNIGTTQTVAVSIGASGVGTSIGGTLTANGNAIFNTGVQEKFATLTGSTGVTAMDCDNGQVFYLTGAAGDITANFTNLGLLAEYGTNVTVIINQGATPYEVTAVQIGGSAQTIEWQGGSAPTGNANGIDSFSFTILRDGGSYVVLGQMVDFT